MVKCGDTYTILLKDDDVNLAHPGLLPFFSSFQSRTARKMLQTNEMGTNVNHYSREKNFHG